LFRGLNWNARSTKSASWTEYCASSFLTVCFPKMYFKLSWCHICLSFPCSAFQGFLLLHSVRIPLLLLSVTPHPWLQATHTRHFCHSFRNVTRKLAQVATLLTFILKWPVRNSTNTPAILRGFSWYSLMVTSKCCNGGALPSCFLVNPSKIVNLWLFYALWDAEKPYIYQENDEINKSQKTEFIVWWVSVRHPEEH
jgi:hypothetical protein